MDRGLHLYLDDRGLALCRAVIDLFSRRVVGWSMKAETTAQLVTDALVMVIWHTTGQMRCCIIQNRAANMPASSSNV